MKAAFPESQLTQSVSVFVINTKRCISISDQAKQVHVKLDDRIISPPEGFLLRKGEIGVYISLE